MLLAFTDSKCALYQQRFDVSPSSADSGGFLLPGALVVLRRKTSPRAKMLWGGRHGHIHTNFRNDPDYRIGLDTRHRHNQFELVEKFLGSRQDQWFQIRFAKTKAVHVGTDNAELFSLFSTHFTVSSLYFHHGCLNSLVKERDHIERFIVIHGIYRIPPFIWMRFPVALPTRIALVKLHP